MFGNYIFSIVTVFIINPKKARTIEPKNAGKNPSIYNPGAKYPASISKSALITRVKTPSVKMFIGNVIKTISGLIKIFIRAIITVTSIALWKFSTLIPGTSHATNIMASVKSIHLTSRTIKKLLSAWFYNDKRCISFPVCVIYWKFFKKYV